MEYTAKLKDYLMKEGADLVGVTDVQSLSELKTIPENLFSPFTHAISIAMQLPRAVFDFIVDQPTPLYSSTYQNVNRLLDEVAYKAVKKLQSDGYVSLPIPASQILDHEEWYGNVSHKAVARIAGLGWQGKNLLLITPEYGSRVRLVTILTSAPLSVDSPVANRCGKCMKCSEACPAGAIKGLSTKDYYKSRNEALDFGKCVSKLTEEFQHLPNVSGLICGICIKVCPWGSKLG
ncbi:epoxyqueuosine reductase [Maridesulfovibrio frigidus]|uniref:epoxyqueuosine reductase n=1 Tax=Maridesulfovibrio frigidus TaxID=340956 RepID=UPI0004E1001B|nr:4Fe-4S double cluster binding domain-containing protein [Maridesulfovibrio frigidus]